MTSEQEHSGFFNWIEDSQRYWFWPERRDPPGTEGWLRDTMATLGTLFGLAAFNGILLDAPFPPFLYEMIVNGGVLLKSNLTRKLEFLGQIYPNVAKNLSEMLSLSEEDLEEVDQTFQIAVQVLREDWESSGSESDSTSQSTGAVVQRLVELKPGGADIRVTGANRKEFLELYCNYVLDKSVASQLQPFRSGFLEVVGGRVVSLCSAEELALMTSGLPLAQGNGLHDLEEVAQYKNGFSKDSPSVRWFWQLVHRSSDEWQRRLLLFITGSDRVPILGLKAMRFVVQRAGDDANHLPVAHTCFNILDLPQYPNPSVLKERLDTALEHVTSFGLV